MKHIIEIKHEGEGIAESARVICSCGYRSPEVFAYSGHYYTNQHKFKQDHLNQVKREVKQ